MLPQSQNNVVDSNRYDSKPPSNSKQFVDSNHLNAPNSSTLPSTVGARTSTSTSSPSSTFLKDRIKQLQADNDALRKHRLLYKNQLYQSNPNLSSISTPVDVTALVSTDDCIYNCNFFPLFWWCHDSNTALLTVNGSFVSVVHQP